MTEVERSSDRLVKRWGAILAFIGLLAGGGVALASRFFVPIDTYRADRDAQNKAIDGMATEHAVLKARIEPVVQRMETTAKELQDVSVSLGALKAQIEHRR